MDADTLAKAREAHRRLVIKSKDGELPVFGTTPPFDEYARELLGKAIELGGDAVKTQALNDPDLQGVWVSEGEE